ncbi:hypothetical protein [Nostoc sp.]|uniref:hypothetical protein n=1 Tax=Nostoc sp. TaxID=1180 RepID=UPI002FF97D7E
MLIARFGDLLPASLLAGELWYSGSRLNEVQEPHPQPPPRKRRGGDDVPHVIRKCYKHCEQRRHLSLEAYLRSQLYYY